MTPMPDDVSLQLPPLSASEPLPRLPSADTKVPSVTPLTGSEALKEAFQPKLTEPLPPLPSLPQPLEPLPLTKLTVGSAHVIASPLPPLSSPQVYVPSALPHLSVSPHLPVPRLPSTTDERPALPILPPVAKSGPLPSLPGPDPAESHTRPLPALSALQAASPLLEPRSEFGRPPSASVNEVSWLPGTRDDPDTPAPRPAELPNAGTASLDRDQGLGALAADLGRIAAGIETLVKMTRQSPPSTPNGPIDLTGGSSWSWSRDQEGFPSASPSMNMSSLGGLRGVGGWGFGSTRDMGNWIEPGRRRM